jgi:hypothetical protein
MTKHNAEEVKILGGKASIYKNQYGIWQFRFWLQNDEKYVRKSLRTKVRIYAVEQAEDLYFEIRAEQQKGKKYYAITIKEAVESFLRSQKSRIGIGDLNIDESRWKTIETQMRTFLDYVKKDDKVNTLEADILESYKKNDKLTNYIAFRKK